MAAKHLVWAAKKDVDANKAICAIINIRGGFDGENSRADAAQGFRRAK
jgi:hypothetical protein